MIKLDFKFYLFGARIITICIGVLIPGVGLHEMLILNFYCNV